MLNVLRLLPTEFRLLFRGTSLWLVLAASIGFMFLFLFGSNGHYAQDIGKLTMQASMGLFPLMLGAFLMAMHAARREHVTKSHLLIPSFPYRSHELILSKLLGLIVPYSLLAQIPNAYYVYLCMQEGLLWHEYSQGVLVMAAFTVPLWWMIALGYGVGTWSAKRWNYLLGILLFLLLTYGVNLTLVQFPAWFALLEFTNLDFFYFNIYSELWGFTTDPLYWWHRLFYAGLCLALIALLCSSTARHRKEQRARRSYLALSTLVTVSIIAIGISYIVIWEKRTDAYRETLAYYTSTPFEQVDPQPYELLQAVSYEMEVDLTERQSMEVHAVIRIVNRTSQSLARLPITLRHTYDSPAFQIGDTPVEFSRVEGTDYGWLELPQPLISGEAVELEANYSGEIDLWLSHYEEGGNLYSQVVFNEKNRVYLPSHYGWYPLPGIHRLVEHEEVTIVKNRSESTHEWLSLSPLSIPPADYQVRITYLDGMQWVTNGVIENESGSSIELRLEDAHGLTLLAGNIEEYKMEQGGTVWQVVVNRLTKQDSAESLLKAIIDTGTWLQQELRIWWGNEPSITLAPVESFVVKQNRGGLRVSSRTPSMVNVDVSMLQPVYHELPEWPMRMNASELREFIIPDLFKRLATARISGEYWLEQREFYSYLAAYLEYKYNGGEGQLIKHTRVGLPENHVTYVNHIFEQVGKKGFPDILMEMMDIMNEPYDYTGQVSDKISTYLQSHAGGGL